MGKLSRFGKHLEERMHAAAMQAQVADQIVERLTPAERVTRQAEQYDSYDQVAQQLGQALSSSMSSGLMGGTYRVTVDPDMEKAWYRITVVANRMATQTPLTESSWIVTDADLAIHTKTIDLFRNWIATVGGQLKVVHSAPSTRIPSTSHHADGWMESSLRTETPEEHFQRVESAKALLRTCGLYPQNIAPTPFEEADAIESIRRTLDADAS